MYPNHPPKAPARAPLYVRTDLACESPSPAAETGLCNSAPLQTRTAPAAAPCAPSSRWRSQRRSPLICAVKKEKLKYGKKFPYFFIQGLAR